MTHKVLYSALALLIILLVSCQSSDDVAKEMPPRLVKSLVIGTDSGINYREYPGRASASEKVDLSFLASGRLIQLPVKEADNVKKGQLIAQIDPKDYEIKVAQQQAKYTHAKIAHDRYKQLVATDAVSKAQYDEKKAIFDLEKAILDEAKKNLSDTSLYAPFTGYIATKYVENFQFVQAKQAIVSLQDLKELEIIIQIPEADVARADQIAKLATESGKEQVATATFAAFPDAQFPLTVKQAQTAADPATQTYKITLLMPMPKDKIILPGMTANVKIRFIGKDEGILIPIDAVFINPKGEHQVWVIDEKTMKVRAQIVKPGDITGDKIRILSGLNKGERIVTAGVTYLQPDMEVKLITGRIGR